jgi:hypothetical protein
MDAAESLIGHGDERGINHDPRHVLATCLSKITNFKSWLLAYCHYPVIIRVLTVPSRSNVAVFNPFLTFCLTPIEKT